MRTLVVLPLLLLAANVHALPAVRVGWDDCNAPLTDRAWSGPGSYTIVVSGLGFAGSYQRFDAQFEFFPRRVVPAWDFSTYDYWGTTPCQGPTRLAIANSGDGCPAWPATQLEAQMWEGSLTGPAPTLIGAHVRFDPAFLADPSQRYTLFKLVFDHAHSVAGAGGPGTCGQVEEPMCVNLVDSSLLGGTGQPEEFAFERSFVTWQDPANTTNCPGATPVRAKTWGAIKATYR